MYATVFIQTSPAPIGVPFLEVLCFTLFGLLLIGVAILAYINLSK